ncbi:hypothetical protein [Lysinibacillus tabacifolii]|uniref:PD-(D/E)XK endonuclease-like domain-containing protein n=1 Tax=Lysinibacillus tabacifolii TaxID=1173107 RepID=A0ABY2SU54_9BACI|nr:hypothetical protein [Lysinibacillus tabacifolii]TKI46245.1 hypothetical protein FC748_18135 [Lysinibacillus tabacifolii]
MTTKVYTYSDPLNWSNHEQFADMQQAFHICATGNMQRGISERYKGEFHKVETVRKVITSFRLFHNWYNAEKRMKQFLLFSKKMNDFTFSTNKLKDAFRANKEEVLNSIRFFVQAGMQPEDLVGFYHTQKERDFQKLWAFFEQHDSQLQEHRRLLLEGDKYSPQFFQEFKLKTKKIYLHGFYFITPEQQIFFKFLQKNGFELIFFQYYDARFPNTFDFIRLFINEQHGWSSDWYIEEGTEGKSKLAELFLQSYEKKNIGKVEEGMTLTKYNTFFDFLQDVIIPNYPLELPPEKKSDMKIFAPNASELNELVQIYYPSLDKENRKFIAHPIGRFLVNMHRLYDSNELVLTSELLIELFSSGWLVDIRTQQIATEYTYDLQQILPYFSNCRTIDEWLTRVKMLAEKKELLMNAFPAKSSARGDEYVRSPFSNLSYFNVDMLRLVQIKEFLEGIRILAEDLFGKEIPVFSSIDVHFSRLLNMLKGRRKMDVYTNKLERDLLDSLIMRLSTINDSTEFLLEDIQPALYLYLSGKFDEDPNKSDELITDFLEFDGEIFKENMKESIYFTAVDEKNLPLSEVSMPWPMQLETMEALAVNYPVIELLLNRNVTAKETSRFLFFIALEFMNLENLHISWIVNRMDAEGLNSALYTRQLHMEVKQYSPLDKVQQDVYEVVQSEVKLSEQEKTSFNESINQLGMRIEFQQCPKRFYYSYVLQPFATYQGDFMYEFIFSNVYRVAVGQEKWGKSDADLKVIDELQPFFPQFKRFKMHAIANSSHPYRYIYENTDVDVNLLRNHFFPGLSKNLFAETQVKLRSDTHLDIVLDNQTFNSIPGYHCRFCPHKNFCPDAKSALDKK